MIHNTDFYSHCDGMAAIEEQEKEALSQVAAFSVFYSIIMFVLLLVILCWSFYTLYQHFKKHGFGSTFSAHDSSGFILQDTRLMIILSYIGMSFYVLSLFCYLIANGSLGVDYNPNNDTYGNSQIVAIIFYFFGHTIFYLLFILKLYNFIHKTTYNMSKTIQITAFATLFTLWFISFIVMIVWIDEFHTNYHVGAVNDERLIACMVIAFAVHIWFCLSLVLFFSIVLYRVVSTKGTTLIMDSSSGGGSRSERKSELEEKIIEYMTRITVLCLSALFVTIFCMLMWLILVGLDGVNKGFLRFCWWLFPINVLFSFLSLFLGLNYHPNMNDVYKKVCICPHAFCKFYCVKASLGKNNKRGQQVRDWDDDDDDDEDDDDNRQIKVNDNDDDDDEERDDYRKRKVRDRDDDDDEDDDDEDDDDSDSERHGFAMNTSDKTAFTKAGE